MSRAPLVVLLALLTCAPEPAPMDSLGGSWYLQEVEVTVFGGHSPVGHQELRRKFGDEYRDVGRIGNARFYAPDCLAWSSRRGWVFACGDHRPIMLPDWVLTAGPEGPIGGYVTQRGQEYWELLPLDSVRRAALRAPPFDSTWAETIKPVPLPKVWVNYRPVADAIEVR